MRRIVHISDLHFGNNDTSLLTPLREVIQSIDPHVLVISGDLVEHATTEEFRSARAFLHQLPRPQIIVPGNHDLAFYNFFRRSLVGLRPYREFITANTSPEYRDDEIVILGANTSRVLPLRGGSLSSAQLEKLESKFAQYPEKLARVLVTHHPFDLPEGQGDRLIVGHAKRSLARLAPVVDILLAGHIHLSSTGSTAVRYKSQGHAIAFVQAGTAISNRNKGEANSFNFLRVGPASNGEKSVVVDRYSWRQSVNRFECKVSAEYRLGKEGWARYEKGPSAEAQGVTAS